MEVKKDCNNKKTPIFEEMYPIMMEDIKKGIQMQFDDFKEEQDEFCSKS